MTFLKASALGFVVALTCGLLQSACTLSNCECPPPPEAPLEQSLPLQGGVRYGADGNTVERPIEFESGTVTVQARTLSIEYATSDGDYSAVYELQDGYEY